MYWGDMRILITLLLCMGFFITVHNTSNESSDCMLYRLGERGFAHVYGGEHDPGEKFKLSGEYSPGTYFTTWTTPRNEESKTTYGFIVGENIKRVFVTPEGALME